MLTHQHLIVRSEVDHPITDENQLVDWLRALVERINMKVMDGPHVKYLDVVGNRGITGVVIIETSHCAIHIWDEVHPYLVQLDVYTCSALDLSEVFAHLDVMKPIKIEYKFLDRDKKLTLVSQNQ